MTAPDEKLAQLNDDFQRLFQLPESERLIDTFFCNLRMKDWTLPHLGTLWISKNLVCWYPQSIGEKVHKEEQLCLKIKDITGIETRKTALVVPNAINISIDLDNYFFAAFTHRDNCHNLLVHLWYAFHQPLTFLHKSDLNGFGSVEAVAATGGPRGGGSGAAGFGDEQSDRDALMGPGANTGKQSAARRALAVAHDTQNVGVSTLNTLAEQGDQITRAQRDVAQIHATLDSSERLIRGMESWGGLFKNGVTKEAGDAVDPTTNKMQIDVLDIPTVRRVPHVAKAEVYQTRIFRFRSNCFQRIDTKKDDEDSQIKQEYEYTDVSKFVVMAWACHVQVYFATKASTLTLISAYWEDIVRAVTERCPSDIPIQFEPNAQPFSRPMGLQKSSGFQRRKKDEAKAEGEGSAAAAGAAAAGAGAAAGASGPSASGDDAADASDFAALTGGAVKKAKPAAKEQPAAKKAAAKKPAAGAAAGGAGAAGGQYALTAQQQAMLSRQKEEDQDLDELNHVLGNLKGISSTMGTTLDRQNQQLTELDGEVDRANARLKNDNKRIIKMT